MNKLRSLWRKKAARIFVAGSWFLIGYATDTDQAIGSKATAGAPSHEVVRMPPNLKVQVPVCPFRPLE